MTNLEALRLSKNLSRDQLAHKVGTTFVVIERMEDENAIGGQDVVLLEKLGTFFDLVPGEQGKLLEKYVEPRDWREDPSLGYRPENRHSVHIPDRERIRELSRVEKADRVDFSNVFFSR